MYTSKLGGIYPKASIERDDAASHKELKKLCREGENIKCAECGVKGTCWASVSLQVFTCFQCSQIHRSLGSHVSKVKSCMGTYLWAPDELQAMREGGNARAKALYGGPVPKPGTASFEELTRIAQQKYDEKKWYRPEAAANTASTATEEPKAIKLAKKTKKKRKQQSEAAPKKKQETFETGWDDWGTWEEAPAAPMASSSTQSVPETDVSPQVSPAVSCAAEVKAANESNQIYHELALLFGDTIG